MPRARRAVLRRLATIDRVWLLNTALAAAAVGLFLRFTRELPALETPLHLPWWSLALAFCATEVCAVHFQFKREAHSSSLGEIPLVIGLFFLEPSQLVLAQLLGAGVALAVYRRQAPIKVAFNLGNLCLEAALAATIFHGIIALGPPDGPAGWLAAFVATFVAMSLGVMMIAAAISLAEGGLQLNALSQTLAMGLVVSTANVSLGLIGATLLWRSPWSLWLLIVPTALSYVAYRGYATMRQQRDRLELLYGSTRVAHESLDLDAVVATLLGQATRMFRAEVAEITLFSDKKGSARRTTMGVNDNLQVVNSIELDPTDEAWAGEAIQGRSVLISRNHHRPPLRRRSSPLAIRDAMVVPIHRSEEVVGTMLVANRLGDVTTFGADDLQLFETLANHTGVSLENARLVGELKNSLLRMTELNRLKDDFVASVSHELRTPLTAIKGYVQVLLRGGERFGAEDRRSMLSSVDRQGDQLARLIEDLLVVSRIEAQELELDTSPVDVARLAAEVVESLGRQALDHALVIDVPHDLPAVVTDAHKVTQVLCNFTENALKYTPAGTTVTVVGRSLGTDVVLSVADQGTGIPVELHGKIFDRFYQVDQTSTREVGGTGLGLYICRRLAEALGGRVWLERSDERGSVFSLALPAAGPLGGGQRRIGPHSVAA